MILSSKEIRKRLGAACSTRPRDSSPNSGLGGGKSVHYPIPTSEGMDRVTGDFPEHVEPNRSQAALLYNGPSEEGAGRLIIEPYSEESQQPASYDLRAGHDASLDRCATTLVSSMEWVELPADLAATLRCRSSYGRRGIILTGGFVDPGFHGQLTLSLINMGPETVCLERGSRVVQMILHQVLRGGEVYAGRYQDSRGVVGPR